jgi:ATP-dependent helicase HrpB
MEPKPSEPMDSQVLRAVRTLQGNQIWNTTLVFLPGKSEIQSCANKLEEALSKSPEPPLILKLFGGQEVVEQAQIFANTEDPRIILTTNIAETSLTIPQVTAVIDSGYERSTDYDFARNLQVLRLNRIAMQNAVQRTGRAGRTRPGVCIRLWGERDEALLPREIIPEIQRNRLQVPLLMRAALAHRSSLSAQSIPWLSAPRADQEYLATQELVCLGFLNADGQATPHGLNALQVPVQSLEVAKMLLDCKNASKLLMTCATWIDAGNEATGPAKESRNLLDLASDLVQERKGIPREILLQFDRIQDWNARRDAVSTSKKPHVITHQGASQLDAQGIRETLQALLTAFPSALATLAETRKAYRLASEATILLEPQSTGNAPAVLAFNLLRSGSGKTQQISRCVFAAIPADLLHQGLEVEDHWELLWRNGQERFTGLCVRRQGERELERFECAIQDASPAVRKILVGLTTAAWADKMTREDLSHHWMSDSIKTLLAKMKWAVKLFEEFQLPVWNEEDWALVMDEFTSGVFLLRDLDEQRFRRVVEEYFGRPMLAWLHKTFPDTLPMPTGRMGKYLIPDPEVGPIELSARIADFLGMQGEHWIAEKRLQVRFDLLAPNYRSVQKTWNLTGFWQNTYALVRKELRGRYPRHPWPSS